MKSLMDSGEYVDHTEQIRQLKHSKLIDADVEKICMLKQTHAKMRIVEEGKFRNLCETSCPFLFNNYTDLFNKIMADELNLKMLAEFLQVLREIEDSELDQYDASVKIGTLLRDIYIDSAVKRGEKLDQENAKPPPVQSKNISWKQFNQARTEIIKTLIKSGDLKK